MTRSFYKQRAGLSFVASAKGGGPWPRAMIMGLAFAMTTGGDVGDLVTAILAHSRGNLKASRLSDRPCPAHTIDQRARILGFRIGAPGNVAVGPHQHEAALVGLAHGRRVEHHDRER